MRVPGNVTMLMVNAVHRNPLERAALICQRAEHGKQALHTQGRSKATVGKQAVVAYRDAEARQQVQSRTDAQTRPRERERRQYHTALEKC
jgi:hypothetical protein